MEIPFFKEMRIGAYLFKQKLLGRKRYPLVLMLEPLLGAAKGGGFGVNVRATIFAGPPPADIAAFLDFAKDLGVGVSISPGYAYERAPDQDHFLNRKKTKELFRDIFSRGVGRNWTFVHSSLFLDFLAGNQTFHCTPWGMPTRNVFGWQKPCYLLGEGNVATFKELMETTDWDSYGTGRYEKCANCMAHCGYEATAAAAMLKNPIQAIKVALRGPNTTGPMAPEIPLDRQRPAQYVYSEQVQMKLSEMRSAEAREKAAKAGGHARAANGTVPTSIPAE